MIFMTILISYFACDIAHANIASASFFKEMRAQNPAVISQRPAASFSLIGSMDKIEKEQDPGASATLTSSSSEIDITNSSFFYGGKGSGFFTTELTGELGSGSKTDNVVASSSTTVVTTDSDLLMINAASSLGRFFGLGVMRVNEDRTQKDSSSSSTSTYDTTVTAITAGVRAKFGFDLGFFYQSTKFEQSGISNNSPISIERDMNRAGVGVGLSNKSFHFEVGYVKNLESISEDQGGGAGPGANVVTFDPAKFTGTVEFKLGKLSLGVTSNYYMDGFFDFNNLVFYTMVLSRNQENRLENAFNFSFGGDKGHSFSGSVSYSTVESQELPPTLSSGETFKTTSKILGVQASYSYAF